MNNNNIPKKTKFSRFFPAAFAAAVLLPRFVQAEPWLDGTSTVKVPPTVPLKVHSFPLEEVRLLDGPFKHAMELDEAYLLALDPDRLLRNFRVNAGLPTSAEPLGGWEAPDCELRGHFVGHYLSACALMYASTGDRRFQEKGAMVVAGLAECQAHLSGGYLSAFPESFFDRVEKRERVWAPYYTLHKILAGLEDMYVYAGNEQALAVARRFGDWVVARNGRLTDSQMQAMLNTEQGGMNEAMANLYALTGERSYLEMALRFNHHAVLDPAERREDRLTGLHANTQIPKFIGAAREYEVTGESDLKTAAEFFWSTVVSNRSYVIGGHSDGEMFTATSRISQMGPNTTETCNTYNMLKLTRHLFSWEPRAAYMDYYERALYNHILASQNPETGMMCYYVPLRSGSRKNYSEPNNSFWCCTGTGVENHAKYGDSIYFHTERDLYVNLMIASELDWKEKGVKVRQETRFPDEGNTRLEWTCAKPVKLAVWLRHPGWATAGYEVRVNGKAQKAASAPGSYVRVERTWRTGDKVEVQMPFGLHLEEFKDKPDRFAVLNGPLVLSAQVDARKPFPALVGDEATLLASLKPVAAQPNTFRVPADVLRTAGGSGNSVEMVPFYEMQGPRSYEVYWDRFTPDQWRAKEQDYQVELARQKELDARTVDSVTAGEEQNERDHNMQGENTDTREFNDRSFRLAGTNGWFSWELKVLPGQPQELSIAFGGGRGAMDIFVNNTKIATESMGGFGRGQAPGAKVYPLNADLLKDKDRITVKFQAPADSRGGSVLGVRVLKPVADRKEAEK